MTIVTERAEIEARAKVTDRMRPLRVDGRRHPPGRAAVALGLRRRRAGRQRERPRRAVRRPERLDPGVQGVHLRRARRAPRRAPTTERLQATRRRRGVAATRTTTPPSSPAGGHSRDRPSRAHRDRRPPRRRAADGLLHRHDGVHRLQGVRGRLQAVERPARPTARSSGGAAPTTTPASCRRIDLAPRALRRVLEPSPLRETEPRAGAPTAVSPRAASRSRPSSRRRDGVDMRPLGVHVRRLQALHERRLPGRLPDRRADPHGVRDRGAAARRLQRLRLLRAGLPVRRRRPRPRRRPRRASARSATTAWRTASSPPAPRRARPTRSSSGPTRSSSSIAERRVADAARARAWRAPTCTAPATSPSTSSPAASGAFFLLTEPPERYGLPAAGRLADPGERRRRDGWRPWAPGCCAAAGARGRRSRSARGGAGDGRRRRARATARRDAGSATRRRSARGGEPGLVAAGGRGRGRRPCTGPRGATRAGRSSTGTTRATATPSPRTARSRRRTARMRAGAMPDDLQGPFIKPPVWTWEVPLYFWFGGMASGSSFVALACDLAGDEWSAARRAQGRARRAVLPAPPLLIVDLGRPERFLNMLRIFKPRSPMNHGRVVPGRVHRPSAPAPSAADLLGRRRAARGLGAVNALLGGYLGLLHRRAAGGHRRAGVGAQPPLPRARSSSPPRRPPAPPPRG